MVKKQYISFDKVLRMCKKIAKEIKKSSYRPDIVIGISRGGWIPARLIAEYLYVKEMASIGIRSYKSVGKRDKITITEKLGVNIKGKNVLIVDDIGDTGETLKFITKYLKGKGAKNIKVATLHYKDKKSKYKPHYYAENTDKWIVYPWEEMEDKIEWNI